MTRIKSRMFFQVCFECFSSLVKSKSRKEACELVVYYVKAESFFARDNVAQFINWCRSELGISDTIMFETEDLVLRKNEKNFILTLLEV